MKIVASPPCFQRRRPFRTVVGADRASPREDPDRKTAPGGRAGPTAEPVARRGGTDGASVASGKAPVCDAGVVAQSVYHERFDGRREESVVHVTRAYSRTDELRFRQTPYTLRVA